MGVCTPQKPAKLQISASCFLREPVVKHLAAQHCSHSLPTHQHVCSHLPFTHTLTPTPTHTSTAALNTHTHTHTPVCACIHTHSALPLVHTHLHVFSPSITCPGQKPHPHPHENRGCSGDEGTAHSVSLASPSDSEPGADSPRSCLRCGPATPPGKQRLGVSLWCLALVIASKMMASSGQRSVESGSPARRDGMARHPNPGSQTILGTNVSGQRPL